MAATQILGTRRRALLHLASAGGSCIRGLMLLVLLWLAWPVQAGPFEQGAVSVSVVLGEGQAFAETYTIFGLGAGYYLLDGLEAGLEYEVWSGGRPGIEQLRPRLNYVFARQAALAPYAGIFFQRTYVDGLADRDARGVRAGAYLQPDSGLLLGFGLAHLRYLDCTETIFTNCSDTYPELIIGLTY